jgi:4-aminobutyrate aminotransferase / (S)-3-amino-2-methylpropionate transaminase
VDSSNRLDKIKKGIPTFEYPGISMKNPEMDESHLLLNDYDAVSNSSSVKIFVDYQKSKGNYIVDADGNVILDVVSGNGIHPLGYNHKNLMKLNDSKVYDRFLQNNMTFTFGPPTDVIELLNKAIVPATPHVEMNSVHLSSEICGEFTNESAIRAAMTKHHVKLGRPEYDHTMDNPNNDYRVISFNGANHGSTLASLSLSNNVMKSNLPMKENWVALDFPSSKADEERVLEEYERSLNEGKETVAAVVVAPIQSLTYEHASPEFYNSLRNLALEHDVTFIVDETFTGCGASGTFWAHTQWNLDKHPDIVTFGRRTQASGFYYDEDFFQEEVDWQFFSNKCGDGMRLLQFQVIRETIEKENLLDKVQTVGESLKNSLFKIDGISNVRGIGTMIAFDTKDFDTNNELLHTLRKNGVNATAAGYRSIATRPALIFEEKHSKEFISTLKKSLS